MTLKVRRSTTSTLSMSKGLIKSNDWEEKHWEEKRSEILTLLAKNNWSVEKTSKKFGSSIDEFKDLIIYLDLHNQQALGLKYHLDSLVITKESAIQKLNKCQEDLARDYNKGHTEVAVAYASASRSLADVKLKESEMSQASSVNITFDFGSYGDPNEDKNPKNIKVECNNISNGS